MAEYWPRSFFGMFMDRDGVEVHKLVEKRMRPIYISSHLDGTSLVNKGFIIWLSGKVFLQPCNTAGSPERASLPSRRSQACHSFLPTRSSSLRGEERVTSLRTSA